MPTSAAVHVTIVSSARERWDSIQKFPHGGVSGPCLPEASTLLFLEDSHSPSASRETGPQTSNLRLLFRYHRAMFRDRSSSFAGLRFLWKSLLRTAALIAILIGAASPAAENPNGDLDRSIKPGDDFYRYANRVWLRTTSIPAGESSYDTRVLLKEKTSQRARDLIQDAARAHSTADNVS